MLTYADLQKTIQEKTQKTQKSPNVEHKEAMNAWLKEVLAKDTPLYGQEDKRLVGWRRKNCRQNIQDGLCRLLAVTCDHCNTELVVHTHIYWQSPLIDPDAQVNVGCAGCGWEGKLPFSEVGTPQVSARRGSCYTAHASSGFTTSEVKMIEEHLKCFDKAAICPVCTEANWLVLPIVKVPTYEGAHHSRQDHGIYHHPGVTLLPLVCQTCAYLRSFSWTGLRDRPATRAPDASEEISPQKA